MALVFRSGFVALVEGVKADLLARGVVAVVKLGSRQIPRQDNQSVGGGNRVIFVPHDERGGAGALVPPHFPGERDFRDEDGNVIATARPLSDWIHTGQVVIWAVDSTAPEDDAKQYEALETLLEEVKRSARATALASLSWGAVTIKPAELRAYGLELTASFTLRHPIFDTPRELALVTGAVARGTYPTP